MIMYCRWECYVLAIQESTQVVLSRSHEQAFLPLAVFLEWSPQRSTDLSLHTGTPSQSRKLKALQVSNTRETDE